MAPFITLDTETTGFTPNTGHKIVEIAAILYKDGVESARFHSYLWPDRDIPPQAQAVHGISLRSLKGKPRFADIADGLDRFLAQAPGWAHNAPFDQRFLDAEFAAAKTRTHPLHCSLKLAKSHKIKEAKLVDLAQSFGWTWEGKGAHSAIEDAKALGHILPKLLALSIPEPVVKTKAPAAIVEAAPQTYQAKEIDDTMDPRFGETVHLFAKRRGQPWTKDEDQSLSIQWSKGASLGTLCQAHGRSPASLALRLQTLGLITTHPYQSYKG